MSNRKRQKKKFSKYKLSSKKLNIDRIKNKYKEKEDIEILEEFNYHNILTKDNFKKVFKLLLVGCFLIVIINFISVVCYNYILMPRIILNGDKKIIINYKQKYKEEGYKAIYRGKNISKFIKVRGKVNSKKLGLYKINYIVKYKSLKRKVTRYVKVEDISKPSIITNYKKDIYTCPNKNFKLSKFKAIDNHDGNITDKVKVKTTKTHVTYIVKDKAGNVNVLKKRIIYEDKEKPEIIFDNEDPVYLYIDDKYKENFKAIDNCDGNITDNVEIEGKVDTSVPAEYKVVYKVKDKAGNERKVVRKVIVSTPNANGSVYLTFDDGPNEGTTNVILDILKEEGVKATFFVTNHGPDELIKREYDEGHTVALHTATHDYSYVYSSVENYFNDLNTVSDRVKRITGKESKIIRFPGGASNTVSRKYTPGIMSELTKMVIDRGYKYYDWNISNDDSEPGNHTSEEVKNKVINSLRKDRVNMVLMHDIKPHTRDALRDIIRYCKSNGYHMEKINMSTKMITQHVNN
ncbi:MAG: polysaccharide deacetylase family protein [Bacilli bacterium]|nr:polysaccharide deacetylase family protein [Bacilli bacterium]